MIWALGHDVAEVDDERALLGVLRRKVRGRDEL